MFGKGKKDEGLDTSVTYHVRMLPEEGGQKVEFSLRGSALVGTGENCDVCLPVPGRDKGIGSFLVRNGNVFYCAKKSKTKSFVEGTEAVPDVEMVLMSGCDLTFGSVTYFVTWQIGGV